MLGTIVELKVATSPVQPVDDEAVALLRQLLARAEIGEIQGVCIAVVESNGAGAVLGVGTAYAGQGVRQNVHAALGGIETLKLRFVRERLEGLGG